MGRGERKLQIARPPATTRASRRLLRAGRCACCPPAAAPRDKSPSAPASPATSRRREKRNSTIPAKWRACRFHGQSIGATAYPERRGWPPPAAELSSPAVTSGREPDGAETRIFQCHHKRRDFLALPAPRPGSLRATFP